MIPQTMEMERWKFIQMLSEFVPLILKAKSDWEVILTSKSGWKISVDCDMASCGGLMDIEWIESPQGERLEPEQIGEWHDGFCHGFIQALARAEAERLVV